MSQLQLSGQLVKEITDCLARHDSAAQDPGVASQYLSAVIGFLLGQEDMTADQKSEILEELKAFAEHVATDVARQKSQTVTQQSQEAFGIWKPGMS